MKTVLALILLMSSGIAAACNGATACLSWVAPTQTMDNKPIATPLWFNIYRKPAAAADTAYVLMRTSTPGQLKINEGGQPSGNQCFVVTAVMANSKDATKPLESVPSPSVCKVFTGVGPSAPTDGRVEAPTDGHIEH